MQDEHGKKIVLNSKEAVEAVKYAAALYKEAMTSDVLSWNDSSNNQYIVSGVGSYIINPISAYRTAQKANKKLRRRHPSSSSRPKARRNGSWAPRPNSTASGNLPRTRKRRSSSSNITPTNWPEAFKASEGYNNPCFANLVPKPMPILSNDPTSTPHDKLAILQDSDKWSAIPGYPGPATPADG